MKLRLSSICFVLLCAAFLLLLAFTADQLPARVASHFNAHGQPDGWMTRSGYLSFVAVMGVALPLFIVGLTYLTRFFPDWMINLPHKEYWLSPARRPMTNAWLVAHSHWLGCLMLLLMGGLHCLTIQANRRDPVEMPGIGLSIAMGGFFVGMAFWVVTLVRRFRKPG